MKAFRYNKPLGVASGLVLAAFRTFFFNSPLGRGDIDNYLLVPGNAAYIILNAYPLTSTQTGWSTASEFKCADCHLHGDGLNGIKI